MSFYDLPYHTYPSYPAVPYLPFVPSPIYPTQPYPASFLTHPPVQPLEVLGPHFPLPVQDLLLLDLLLHHLLCICMCVVREG